MSEPLGYNKPLYLLPFDHRASFSKVLLGIGDAVSEKDRIRVQGLKEIIYDAFKVAIASGIPKEHAAILVDEEYGEVILHDARAHDFITCLTIEKSGQKVFAFEYEDYKSHVNKIKPTFVKALVRYNPEGDKSINATQRERLKELSIFAHDEGYKFLIEPLVTPTVDQLYNMGDSRERYDKEMRPALTIEMIKELQADGIEPDVWKIEGMQNESDYIRVVREARNKEERARVGVIILGRGEDKKNVESWLTKGKRVDGIIGFAVGRTVFFDPLIKFKNGEISREKAVEDIATNYKYFYDLFVSR